MQGRDWGASFGIPGVGSFPVQWEQVEDGHPMRGRATACETTWDGKSQDKEFQS